MKTKVVQVLIHRNITSTVSDVVYAHEVPILRVIRGHGAINVTSKSCKGYELKPREVNPRDELIRLKRKYQGFVDEGQHPVDVAFPDGSRDIELFYKDPGKFENTGLEIEDEEEELMSSEPSESPEDAEKIEDSGTLDEIEDDESTDLSLADDIDPIFGINMNDRPSVIEELERKGVEFAKTTPTKHLAALLQRTVEVEEGAQA